MLSRNTPSHGHDYEFEKFRSRVILAACLVTIAFFILLARFAYLQIVRHEYYQTRAEDNRITLVPIVPNRGIIYDRNGVVLARNYSAFTLEITPSKVENLDETIERLGELVTIEAKDKRRFRKLYEESKLFESIPIRVRLTDEEVAKFTARRYLFPGVEVNARLFRQYPLGPVGVHALGFINRVNKTDLKMISDNDQESNYKGTTHIGKTGLEQRYEFELHGQAGHEEIEIDASGHAVRSLARTPPISGNNLTLTLDSKLQQVVEKAFGDRRGALVAIEPSTGGILALVSMPTFDPNLFVDGIRTEDWEMLNNSPDRPMTNRAIDGTYPPGSTFKPFMALAALELGKRRPEQAISDPGFFTLGNHTFRDDKAGGHGLVDMYKSIVHSCDTYYYVLANEMGIDNISNFMGPLGFGAKTGVDLSGESEGVLPSPQWKLRRKKQKWLSGDTISIGIGQGYNSYTIIQLAQATATLANDGVLFRPHLVKHIADNKTGEQRLIEPEPLRTLPWKQKNIDVIKKAMVGVNTEGTGTRAFAGAAYQSAGKTGTSQVYSLRGGKYNAASTREHLRDHALFIAFAPVDQPKIALAVLVENGGFGARSAAPIARTVMDYYLQGQMSDAPAQEVDATDEED